MLRLTVFDLHDLRLFPKKKKSTIEKLYRVIDRAKVIGF